MNLTEAFFHGHDHLVVEADGFITPYRMSADRLAYYAQENDVFAPRAQNSSGISIEFETAADDFTLDLQFTNEVRNENSLTIFENGRLAQIISVTWDEPKNKLFYRKKNQQALGVRCHYAIYLPTMATVRLQNLSAEDAIPTPKREKQLLALGDSITQGVYCQASANAYATRLARKLNMELCNQAVGGYYFNADAFLKDANPNIITLAYGINDISRLDGTEQIAQTILQAASACLDKIATLYPHVPVFCITPLWRGDFTPAQEPIFAELTEGLLALCAQKGVYSINGCEVFPHDITLFTDGYLHPNDDGFAYMTNAFADAIAKAGVL